MSNLAYRRGANFERRVNKNLRDRGFYVIRSAGSHGIVDSIAFRQGEVWIMQKKIPGYESPHNKELLAFLAKENNFRAFLVSRENKPPYNLIFEELEVKDV